MSTILKRTLTTIAILATTININAQHETQITQKLIIPYTAGTPIKPYKEFIQDYKIGGIILMGKYTKKSAKIICDQLKKWSTEANRPPLIIGVDQEGGRVNRIRDGFPQYESAKKLKEKGNTTIFNQGKIIGKALKEIGINMVFAPVVDVRTNKEDTVLKDRSYSDNPKEVREASLAYILGIEESKTIAVAKHFPGHGGVKNDSHHKLPIFKETMEELVNTHIHPFKFLIHHKLNAIMISHVLYTKLDIKNPASLSKKITTDLLRNKLNFKGIIITDDITMGALKKYGNLNERIYKAVNAGANFVITTKIPDMNKLLSMNHKENYK